MDPESIRLLAGVLALMPLIAVAISLGWIFSSYNNAVARNPNAAEILNQKFFLTFALTEALAIFALLVALPLVFG